MSRRGLAGSKKVCMDNFDNIAKFPSIKAIPSYIPRSKVWASLSSDLHQSVSLNFRIFATERGDKWCLGVVSFCIYFS